MRTNTLLKHLECDGNKIESLILPDGDALEYLSCSRNYITNLDLSGKSNLSTLILNDNNLENLNLRGCTNLKTLSLCETNIGELDLSGCPRLTELNCEGCPIRTLDISMLPNLKSLDCSHTSFDDLFVLQAHVNKGLIRKGENIPLTTEVFVVDALRTELHYVTESGGLLQFNPTHDECHRFPFNVPVWSNTYGEEGGVITFAGVLERIDGGCEKGAFESNRILKEVTFPSSLKSLMNDCFRGCINLQKVTMSPGLEFIGWYTFAGCSSLTEIIIPDTVRYIGAEAFRDCGALQRIVCLAKNPPGPGEGKDEVDFEGGNMFPNTGNAPIYVPAESVEKYRTAQYWSEYADRIFSLNEMSE